MNKIRSQQRPVILSRSRINSANYTQNWRIPDFDDSTRNDCALFANPSLYYLNQHALKIDDEAALLAYAYQNDDFMNQEEYKRLMKFINLMKRHPLELSINTPKKSSLDSKDLTKSKHQNDINKIMSNSYVDYSQNQLSNATKVTIDVDKSKRQELSVNTPQEYDNLKSPMENSTQDRIRIVREKAVFVPTMPIKSTPSKKEDQALINAGLPFGLSAQQVAKIVAIANNVDDNVNHLQDEIKNTVLLKSASTCIISDTQRTLQNYQQILKQDESSSVDSSHHKTKVSSPIKDHDDNGPNTVITQHTVVFNSTQIPRPLDLDNIKEPLEQDYVNTCVPPFVDKPGNYVPKLEKDNEDEEQDIIKAIQESDKDMVLAHKNELKENTLVHKKDTDEAIAQDKITTIISKHDVNTKHYDNKNTLAIAIAKTNAHKQDIQKAQQYIKAKETNESKDVKSLETKDTKDSKDSKHLASTKTIITTKDNELQAKDNKPSKVKAQSKPNVEDKVKHNDANGEEKIETAVGIALAQALKKANKSQDALKLNKDEGQDEAYTLKQAQIIQDAKTITQAKQDKDQVAFANSNNEHNWSSFNLSQEQSNEQDHAINPLAGVSADTDLTQDKVEILDQVKQVGSTKEQETIVEGVVAQALGQGANVEDAPAHELFDHNKHHQSANKALLNKEHEVNKEQESNTNNARRRGRRGSRRK